ncbi:MAG: hypothetical protein AAB074_14110 [Planctomycetota bacterium]
MFRLAVALMVAALSSTAFAKPPDGVRWAGSWQIASDEAMDRHVPILVVFVRQDEAGLALEKSVLTGKEFIAASKKWVTVYCNRDEGQPEKKEGDKSFSTLTPGITVDQHKAAWKELSARFYKTDDANAPSVVWCNPEGEEFGRLEGAVTSRDLVAKMGEAVKKLGPGLEAGDYVDAISHLAAADSASQAKKTGEAVREYSEVLKMQKKPGAGGVVSRAQAGMDRLNNSGRVVMEQANECTAAEDFARAEKLLKEILDNYRGLPIAKEAEKIYDDVCKKAKAKEKDRIDGGDGKR